MRKIDGLLSPIVRRLGIEGELNLERIKADWHTLFAEPLSLHISPGSLHNNVLHVYVDSSVWLQQMSFCRAEVVKKLSPFGVKDVQFRIGRNSPRRRKEKREAPLPERATVSVEAQEELVQETSAIKDQALRELVLQTMSRAFSQERSKKSGSERRTAE